MPRRILNALLALASTCALAAAAGTVDNSNLTFEADIRPVLKAYCFDCHGEGEKLNGGVDLRLRHFMVETKTDDGLVMVPGHPESSLLIKAIESGDMPKKGKKLST